MLEGTTSLIAIDVGGTFIDFVVLRDHQPMRIHKHLSRPENIAAALLEGLTAAVDDGVGTVVHGTTVATNAIIQRRGARTALVTTEGYADVIEIGRQDRPNLYAFSQEPIEPLVPREHRHVVPERIGAEGEIVVPLAEDALGQLIRRLADDAIEAVAICLLFSFRNPDHERRVARALREGGIPFVTASHEVSPQFREFERTTTTVANAFVSPTIAAYLDEVDDALRDRYHVAAFDVMQSSGGLLSAAEAKIAGVRLLLSGPAAGVAAGFQLCGEHDIRRVITFDMGGTSTDVALCDGAIPTTSESVIAGVPVRIPMVALETVGAGGGSIARIDAGGGLRVGPESVASDPGPACFGRGEIPSVTDAQAVCGLLDAASFLGGQLSIDLDRARRAIASLAPTSGADVETFAAGILRVAEASMERAIRRISVEKGHDPRDFTLCAFGGAGPLHACALAESLGMRTILIPLYPGVSSALGMAMAEMEREFSQTVLGMSDLEIGDVWQSLERQAEEALPGGSVARRLECRYAGQGYEIELAAEPYTTIEERFHAAHEQRFGFSDASRSVEVVASRVVARRERSRPMTRAWEPAPPSQPGVARAVLDGLPVQLPVVERLSLPIGATQSGPALLVQPDSAVLIRPSWIGNVLADGCLLLERSSR